MCEYEEQAEKVTEQAALGAELALSVALIELAKLIQETADPRAELTRLQHLIEGGADPIELLALLRAVKDSGELPWVADTATAEEARAVLSEADLDQLRTDLAGEAREQYNATADPAWRAAPKRARKRAAGPPRKGQGVPADLVEDAARDLGVL